MKFIIMTATLMVLICFVHNLNTKQQCQCPPGFSQFAVEDRKILGCCPKGLNLSVNIVNSEVICCPPNSPVYSLTNKCGDGSKIESKPLICK
jgi:hypothetical protein